VIVVICSVGLGFDQSFYAVQTHFGQYYRADMDSTNVEAMLDLIQSAGIRAIRDECYWSLVETNRGVFDFPREIDHYVQAARQRGIGVLLILDYNNPLYAEHAGSGVTTDSNRAAFARYCQEAVQHFLSMGVKQYEIWNEPNIPIFWAPTPNASDYTELLKVAYPAIKAIDSTITVMTGATSPAEGDPAPFIEGQSFIQQVFQAGGAEYMDAVSFHLYRVTQSPEDWIYSYPSVIRNIVGPDIPLYLTEVGYPTSSVWPYVDLTEQSVYITKAYLMGRDVPNLQLISWYDFKNDGQDPNNNEANFGIVNFDLSPKPAYRAYHTVVRLTGGKTLLIADHTGNEYVYTFAESTDTCVVCWYSQSSGNREVNIPCGHLAVLDLLGDTLSYFYNRDGRADLSLTQRPKYYVTLHSATVIEKLNLWPNIDTVVMGQNIQLNAGCIVKDGRELAFDTQTCLQWSFDTPAAVVDSTGRFQALNAGEGILRIAFEDFQFEKQITVIPPYATLEIEPFNTLENFEVTTQNLLAATTFAIIDTSYTTPEHSLAVNYALKYISSSSHKIILDSDIFLPGEPDSILMDIKNNNPHYLQFYLEDRDHKSYIVKSDNLADQTHWQSCGAVLDKIGSRYNYPAVLKRIVINLQPQDAVRDCTYTGRILLDNLRLHGTASVAVRSASNLFQASFRLEQNYPNPFNPATAIHYQIPEPGQVDLRLYNVLGQCVKTLVDAFQPAGAYTVILELQDLPSGIYFYRLHFTGEIKTRKLMLLK
jgi:hypothetical protein